MSPGFYPRLTWTPFNSFLLFLFQLFFSSPCPALLSHHCSILFQASLLNHNISISHTQICTHDQVIEWFLEGQSHRGFWMFFSSTPNIKNPERTSDLPKATYLISGRTWFSLPLIFWLFIFFMVLLSLVSSKRESSFDPYDWASI